MTTKLGLFRSEPEKCSEIAIDSAHKLSYVRHITRERLRTFSRYNMAAQLPALAGSGLRLDSCSNNAGVCSIEEDVRKVIRQIVPAANLDTFDSVFDPNYQEAARNVDITLSSWRPFLDSVSATGKLSALDSDDILIGTGVNLDFSSSASKSFLQELINPIEFLRLHSNFIIMDTLAEHPDATDDTTARAFMLAPMRAIVGLDSYFNSSPESGLPPESLFKSGNN